MPVFERHFAGERIRPGTLPRAPARQLADTGQGFGPQALAEAGGALTDTASVLFKWNEREGNSEYDTLRGLYASEIGSFERTPFKDTTTLEAGFKKLEADLAKLPSANDLKNKSGLKKYKEFMTLNKESRDKIKAEKSIRMVARNLQSALFVNLSNVAQQPDRDKAIDEINTLIQGGLDDGSIKTATQGLAIRDRFIDDWTVADVNRRSQTIIRADGEVDWTATVDYLNQPKNTEGIDSEILKSIKSNAETELANQKKRDAEEIERQREFSLDGLNETLQKDQLPTPGEIDRAKLAEIDAGNYARWTANEQKRIATGVKITTNEFTRAQLNTMALDIWRGAVTKRQFDTAANEARYGEKPTIDKDAYRDVTNTAATTLKSAQAEALSRADTEASRVIVDFRTEDAFAAFLKGLDTTNRDSANEDRQLQFDSLSRYNKEMRDWITANPEKIGKDFYQHSEQLKHDYWNTNIEELRARKAERTRPDGTLKGTGFFGPINLPDGRVATEFSIGVELDGKETQIPTLVPTLTKAELDLMTNDIIPNNKSIPEKITQKAISHARKRIKEGKSPFAGNGPVPKTITMVAPNGTPFTVPIKKRQLFIDNGYTDGI